MLGACEGIERVCAEHCLMGVILTMLAVQIIVTHVCIVLAQCNKVEWPQLRQIFEFRVCGAKGGGNFFERFLPGDLERLLHLAGLACG